MAVLPGDIQVVKQEDFDAIAVSTGIPGSEETNFYEGYTEATAAYNTSTFGGWGGHIGTPQDFNTLYFRLVNRDTTEITQVRVGLTTFNKSGTVLVDKLISCNVPVGESRLIKVDLGITITNPNSDKLYFIFQTSKLVTLQTATLPSAANDVTFGKTTYALNSTPMNYNFSGFLETTNNLSTIWTYTTYIPTTNTLKAQRNFVAGTDLLLNDDTFKGSFELGVGDHVKSYEFAPFNSISNNTSTFSGWGSHIGTPENFNYVKFRVINRGSSPITKVKVWLTEFNKMGAILATETLTVNVGVGVDQIVTWDISKTTYNSLERNIYFSYQCDQLCSLANTVLPQVADDITYGKTAYAISATQTSCRALIDNSTNVNMGIWTEIGVATNFYAPSDKFINAIGAIASTPDAGNVQYDNATSGLSAINCQDAIDEVSNITVPNRIILPDEIVAVVGDKLQLFYRGIIEAQDPYIQPYEIICSIGKAYPRYFELTPVVGDVGTKTLTVNLLNNKGNIIVTKSTTLRIINPTAQPSSNKNILCIGDSLTAGGVWVQEMYRRLTQSGGTPAGNGYANTTFIGNSPMSSYPTQKFVGVGGWTWGTYTNQDPAKAYWVTCTHDKDSSDQKAYYRDTNNNLWFIETVEATRIKFVAYAHSSSLPSATSLLTWVSGGSHHTTINYTAIVAEAGTPFWNGSSLSFTSFMNTIGKTGENIDVAYILLGWNSLSANQAYASDHQTNIDKAKVLLNQLKADYPNVIVRIMGLQVPSPNGGLAANYGATGAYSNYYKLLRSVNGLNLAYQDMCNELAYSGWCKFISTAAHFDSENNMQSSLVAVNSRNSTTELQGTNGVHPADCGYLQISDPAYRDYVRSFCS